MKIRSITVFIEVDWPVDQAGVAYSSAFVLDAREAFQAAGYEVQTTRLATTPFPHWVRASSLTSLRENLHTLEGQVMKSGFEYLSLGPALPEEMQSYAIIPELLAETQNVFFAGLLTTQKKEISLSAIKACARVIHRAAPLSPDGFANLRFAALANVAPGSPFFPAAYHRGGQAAFALATEAADLAVEAFSAAQSLEEARQNLIASIESKAEALRRVAQALEASHGLAFTGIDFSLAPFPEQTRSIGEAMERLGVPRLGMHGSLATAAIITECVDRASFQRAGFSGLFLPVLEDAVLAQRAAEGTLTVKDLLMYAAVCGTGLDTIPLAGDTSVAALEAVLLDLAVLAHRLDKPLTARLMPIPGKVAGEPTGFDFTYFANSRVMTLDAGVLLGCLAGSENLSLQPRHT